MSLINRCLVTHDNKRHNTKEIKHTFRTKVDEIDSFLCSHRFPSS